MCILDVSFNLSALNLLLFCTKGLSQYASFPTRGSEIVLPQYCQAWGNVIAANHAEHSRLIHANEND